MHNHIYLSNDSHYLRQFQREQHLAEVCRVRALEPEQQARYLNRPVDTFTGRDRGVQLQALVRQRLPWLRRLRIWLKGY